MNQFLLIIGFLFCASFLNAQIFQSSNLPIVKISTNGQSIVNDPRIVADMEVIFNGMNMRNHINDTPNDYNGKIAIELRGQSSQGLFDKKSYRVETQDIAGEDLNVSLLGLSEESDWILYAPYSDKTLMRNVLMYELSNQIGQYASNTRYCELLIDGEYKGVYVLMETLKRDKNRIDIAKMKETDIRGDDLTGGYLLRLDKYDEADEGIWTSDYSNDNVRIEYQLRYPKPKNATTEQIEYIQSFMSDFETALRSPDFRDEDNGYRKYIDINSFVDYLLLNELSRNPDAYRISTYLHKENINEGGKLKMGPIWDFNIAFGNVDFCIGESYEGWVLNYNNICPDDYWLIPYWWDKLLTDKYFRDAVRKRWKELRSNELSQNNIYGLITDYKNNLNEAQVRNFEKWNILNQYIWPNTFLGGTYENEISHFKWWINQRLIWMDQNIDFISSNVQGDFRKEYIEIYPNPVESELNIRFKAENGEITGVTILNVLGQEKFSIEIGALGGVHDEIIINNWQLKQMQSGVYFIVFFRENEAIETLKFFKK